MSVEGIALGVEDILVVYIRQPPIQNDLNRLPNGSFGLRLVSPVQNQIVLLQPFQKASYDCLDLGFFFLGKARVC